jgi:DNA-directed RNA polymerase subunit RPC12/RpoP
MTYLIIFFGVILIALFLSAILVGTYKILNSKNNNHVRGLVHHIHPTSQGKPFCRTTDSTLRYEELLKLPQWKNKRHSILERDGYKCKYCGSKQFLNVHHKYYLKYPNNQMIPPWKYNDDALITLCNNCHKKVHQKNIIKVYYTSY